LKKSADKFLIRVFREVLHKQDLVGGRRVTLSREQARGHCGFKKREEEKKDKDKLKNFLFLNDQKKKKKKKKMGKN